MLISILKKGIIALLSALITILIVYSISVEVAQGSFKDRTPDNLYYQNWK